MDRDLGRRAALAAIVGIGAGGLALSPAANLLDRFAPLSGSVWQSGRQRGPSTVESPHGTAVVRHDSDGVPHIRADDEAALYFAVGYVQGRDRLFQLDIQRRLYRGELAAVVGEPAVESDRFHRQMGFSAAAAATADQITDTHAEIAIDAFVDGLNSAIEHEPLPLEFRLLDYTPGTWSRSDTALLEKFIAWELTGSFRTLRMARIREQLGADYPESVIPELYPDRFTHDVPIIQDHHSVTAAGSNASYRGRADASPAPDADFLGWVSRFVSPANIGSNSWVIGPDLTANNASIVGNDPHLSLQAPPTWYEMHVSGPHHRARGVTFPGTPFVIIGENDSGAWGFTNAGADVIDFYQYDHDGESYVYGDEEREFEIESQSIAVAGDEAVDIEVKRSVHGPIIERHDQVVGVAWTGHTATNTISSLYQMSHSTGIDDIVTASKLFDAPTQNLVYADREGNTLYQLTGRIPLRRINGEPVSGDQIFDGSQKEGEWQGFVPFGESTWEGFVPFEAKPQVRNFDYLATANQQIIDDAEIDYYLAAQYANPFRGARIYELLDERVAAGEPIDLEFLREVGRDTYDGRTILCDPLIDALEEGGGDRQQNAATLLEEWDGHMDADSRAALLFDIWFRAYRHELFKDRFTDVSLTESDYPPDAAIVELDPASEWFAELDRSTLMRMAADTAFDEISGSGADVYGDMNHTGYIHHPFEIDSLSYESHPRGGTGETVWNYNRDGPWGGSWEMQVDLAGDLLGVLPGGNSGKYFSAHYTDQLEQWASGDYRRLSRELAGEITLEFTESTS